MRLIDADALQKQFDEKCIKDCEFCPFYLRWITEELEEEGCCVLIQRAPTIDAVPVVHARWILEESPYAEHEEAYDGESHDRYVCSRCKCEAGFGCDADGFATDQNLDDWCSNCGARMDGGENG